MDPQKPKANHYVRRVRSPNSLIFRRLLTEFGVLAFSNFRRSKTAQEAPKTAPRRPKRPQRALQDGPKGLQDGPRGPQDGPRGAPVGPERFPREPQEGYRRPQEVPKRAPRDPQDGPCPPRRPKRAPGRPKRAPIRPKRAPKGPPGRPGNAIFIDFCEAFCYISVCRTKVITPAGLQATSQRPRALTERTRAFRPYAKQVTERARYERVTLSKGRSPS